MMMSSCDQPRARTSDSVTGKNSCSNRPRRVGRRIWLKPDIERLKVALTGRFARRAQLAALVARAGLAQRTEIVDSARVTVGPIDVHGVVADEPDGTRAHGVGHLLGIEQRLTGHLLDALGTAAGEA